MQWQLSTINKIKPYALERSNQIIVFVIALLFAPIIDCLQCTDWVIKLLFSIDDPWICLLALLQKLIDASLRQQKKLQNMSLHVPYQMADRVTVAHSETSRW